MGFTYWLKISATEIVRLNTLKPFARREYGRISSVYDTMRGVNAKLLEAFVSDITVHQANQHSLVERVEQEDERDDSHHMALYPGRRARGPGWAGDAAGPVAGRIKTPRTEWYGVVMRLLGCSNQCSSAGLT